MKDYYFYKLNDWMYISILQNVYIALAVKQGIN